MGKELILVKWGGSLLTDKRLQATARPEVLARLASELAAGRRRLGGGESVILGHGSGSFGHVAAARYGLSKGPLPDTKKAREGLGVTQDQAARLHRLVVDALLEVGEQPYSLPPSSLLMTREGQVSRVLMEPLEGALSLDLVPVVYGDVVMDQAWGATIASTETVLLGLIRRLRRRGHSVRRILWLGETAGIYDHRGDTVPRIDSSNYRAVSRSIHDPAGTDVTGGMLLRLKTARKLARAGIESWILDGTQPGLFEAALSGEEVPGTRLPADRNQPTDP